MSRSSLFLSQVEEFLVRSGMTPTVFGKRAANDPSFVRDLRKGRKPSIDFVERVQRFIANADAENAIKAALAKNKRGAKKKISAATFERLQSETQ